MLLIGTQSVVKDLQVTKKTQITTSLAYTPMGEGGFEFDCPDFEFLKVISIRVMCTYLYSAEEPPLPSTSQVTNRVMPLRSSLHLDRHSSTCVSTNLSKMWRI